MIVVILVLCSLEHPIRKPWESAGGIKSPKHNKEAEIVWCTLKTSVGATLRFVWFIPILRRCPGASGLRRREYHRILVVYLIAQAV